MKRCHHVLSVFSLVFILLALTACMPESRAGKTYSRDQAMTSQSVYYGVVLRVEDVTLEGTQTGAGTVGGAAMGGVLGSAVGSGAGRSIATVGGAIVGALAGSAAEKGVTTKDAQEIEVSLDNGETLIVVQEKDEAFVVGDRVRVIRGPDGTTRVRQ